MLTADAMSTVRHLSVVWTHLRPSELLLLAHCGLLEHLFSTLHQPHSRPPFVMQALQSVKLEHSSTGRRWTLGRGVEEGWRKTDVKACVLCWNTALLVNVLNTCIRAKNIHASTYFIFSECIDIV